MIFRSPLYLVQQESLTFVHSMFSLKNKKQNLVAFFFVLSLFCGALFLLQAHSVNAQNWSQGTGVAYTKKVQEVSQDAAQSGGLISLILKDALYYLVFVPLGWFASIAVSLFGWAVKPEYISGPGGLLNRSSVYVMWQFIRDFFNLFFILTLLYTAFTIVFQVAKDYKKTLLSLVLAALFVNFSFPITRVIIDVTNVPMYYFVNQIGAQTGGKQDNWLGTVLSASQLKGILIPGAQDGGKLNLEKVDMSRLMMAIIFLFIFSITLLVLAVLFVVRLVALVILLIFASVGFAASVIPGMGKYSTQWWENLWKYALFGPAAMLMLFVATQFFAQIATDNTKVQFLEVANGNTTQVSAGFISSMAMFSVPIIMLWFAIGLGGSMAIAGGTAVTGTGKKFLKWAGRKTYNNTLTRGLGKGIKERAENNKVFKFATPKYWAVSSKKNEERIAARVGGGRDGYNRTVENQHNKKVAEKEKEMEELRTSATDLKRMILPGSAHSAAEKEAAVNILAKKEQFSNANELHNAVEAIKASNANPDAQREKILALTRKANGDSLGGMSVAQYNSMDTMGPEVKKELDRKLKKEGHTKVLIDAEIALGTAPQDAYDKYLGSMSAEELGKVKGIHGSTGHPPDAELVAYVTDQVSTGNWSPKEHADAYSKLSAEQKAAWRMVGIHP